VKANGTLPSKAKKVGLINNGLHSLWSSVAVYLNDVSIANTQDFGYRSYINTCLTYSSLVKGALLTSQG